MTNFMTELQNVSQMLDATLEAHYITNEALLELNDELYAAADEDMFFADVVEQLSQGLDATLEFEDIDLEVLSDLRAVNDALYDLLMMAHKSSVKLPNKS